MKVFNEIASSAFPRSNSTRIFFLKPLCKVFVFVLPMLAVAATASVARAERIAGRLLSVNGAVQVVRRGKTLTATNGMVIQVHDKLVTLVGGSVTIVMPDHRALHLDQSGTVSIDESTLMKDSIAPNKPDCSTVPCIHTSWVQ